MPRGAEYANEPPQSDNAITHTHDITHGAQRGTTADAPIDKAHKTAPLPEGLAEEVNDRTLSGGGSGNAPGNKVGSGKGGGEPHHGSGAGKGLGGEEESREGK